MGKEAFDTSPLVNPKTGRLLSHPGPDVFRSFCSMSPSFALFHYTGSAVNEANEVPSLSVMLLHISFVSWVRVTLLRLRRMP